MKSFDNLLTIILDPKNRLYVLVGVIFFILFVANLLMEPSADSVPNASSPNASSPLANIEKAPEFTQEQKDSIYSAAVYERFEDIEKAVNSDKGMSSFPSREAIDIRILTLREYTSRAYSSDFDNFQDLKPKAKKLQTKVRKLKATEYPKMRRDFGKVFDEMMWEYDIDVFVKGSNNSIIEVVGSLFAANKNIKFVHEKMQERLVELKFKRAQYKWSKYDDEYTYYTLSPSTDTE